MAAPLPKGTAMSEETPSAESTETSTTSTTHESAEPTTGQQQTSTTSAFDPSTLSPEAQAWHKDQLEKAGFKARDNARKTAAAEAEQRLRAEFAQKLGLAGEGDEAPSAEELTGHLEAAQAQAFQAGVELQLTRVAGRLGGDVEAMLDSNRFMDDFIGALDENENAGNMDPRSREFAAAVEVAAAKALEKNPRLKATPSGPRPDPSQGARGQGPSGLDAQIAQAEANGDIRSSIRLKLQREKQQQKP